MQIQTVQSVSRNLKHTHTHTYTWTQFTCALSAKVVSEKSVQSERMQLENTQESNTRTIEGDSKTRTDATLKWRAHWATEEAMAATLERRADSDREEKPAGKQANKLQTVPANGQSVIQLEETLLWSAKKAVADASRRREGRRTVGLWLRQWEREKNDSTVQKK